MQKLDLSYLGPLLKNARITANLTQDEIAEKVDVSTRYIMAIENEGKTPSLDIFLKISRALAIPSDPLIYPELLSEDDEIQQITRMLSMLNKRDLSIVRTTISKMLDSLEQ